MVEKVIAVWRDGAGPPRTAGVVYRPIEGEPGADRTVTSVWMVRSGAAVDVSGASAAYLVDERRYWGTERPEGVTRLSFLQAAAGLTRDQFGDHWRDVHAPLARRHHPNILRYTQNVVVTTLTPDTPPVDGIAELTFASVDDMRARRYDSEEGQRIVGEDVRRFIDLAAGWRVLVRAEEEAGGNRF